MLKLCGFHLSNYHNKVRIALLEKGVQFEEDPTCSPSQKEEWLPRPPPRQAALPPPAGGPRRPRPGGGLREPPGAAPPKPPLPEDPHQRAPAPQRLTLIL